MPRKKVVRNVVDKKDDFIEPKEALEMLGIVTNNETIVDTPVEEPVKEVPEVHVPKIHHVIISYREGPYEHAKIVGSISYHELTNSFKMEMPHPRGDAVFKNLMNCDYTIKEDGVSRIIPVSNKQEWITNLCKKAVLGDKFEASEPVIYNEVG